MPHRTSPLILSLLLLLAGCRAEATASSGPLQGRYVLLEVDGARLPSTIGTFGSAARVAIADTLYFSSASEGLQVSVYRNRLPTGDGPVHTQRLAFRHERDGSEIFLSFSCPDEFSGSPVGCTAAPQMRGTLSGDRLVFTAAYSFRTPLRYRSR